MKKTRFANGEFYHIFNRGTDKRIIFQDKYDIQRFIQSMKEFNSIAPIGSIYQNSFRPQLSRPTAKLVNIVCYCLNPNHFHMILEQKKENGVSEFMKRLDGGYAWYFNAKNKRTGSLFQGKFKSIHVSSNEYLLHLSSYINLNNKVHRIRGNIFQSSWPEYIGLIDRELCSKNVILNQFKNLNEYKEFAESSLVDILRRKDLKKEVEKLLLE